jgi:hypothetical protein
MPAPIVADALGYHPVTTTRLAHTPAPPGAATRPATIQSDSGIDFSAGNPVLWSEPCLA